MKPRRNPVEKALVGPAGEHYVLFRLFREGLMAALAPPRSPMIDILVLSADGSTVTATVQVKTRTIGADKGWHFSKKHEDVSEDRLFYALVDLEPDTPVTYIVPSSVVARAVRRSHEVWLATPGKDGSQHNDHNMRRLRPIYPWPVPGFPPGWLSKWADRWDLIADSDMPLP